MRSVRDERRLSIHATGWLGVVVFGALVVAPALAWPCSVERGYRHRMTAPEDGALDVPTNARILVSYDAPTGSDMSGFDPRHLELRRMDGAAVAFTVETPGDASDLTRVLTPMAPLVAGATYQVLDRLPPTCERPLLSLCEGSTATVIATFTVGSSADTSPPSFAGARIVESNYFEAANDSCGERPARIFHDLAWPAASDGEPSSWLRYHVYDRDGLRLRSFATDRATMYVDCTAEGDAGYVVRAVDLAGNEDGNTQVLGGPRCADFQGGCCATRTGGAPALAAAVFVLVWRRRRRAR